MARTSTYLNFPGNTESAFAFYKTVFGSDYLGPIARMGDAPRPPELPALSESEQKLVMHVALPITGGHVLMGTDAVPSMGHTVTLGNHFSLNLEPDTVEEAQRLFAALSEGGTVQMPLQKMFWGAWWGSLVDAYGIQWMVNCAAE